MNARDDRGAAAVEFALVLPFLILLICGMIDFGRAYHDRITVTNAAREGVRVWALGGDLTATTDRVTAAAAGLDGVAVTATPCDVDGKAIVVVTATFTYLTPLIAELTPTATTLTGRGVMRCGG